MRDRTPPVLWQGFVAGLVGYAVIATAFGIGNVLAGRSFFFTAALLGEALLHPGSAFVPAVVDPGSVLAYNGVHLLGFLLLGFAAATLVEILEHFPSVWYLVFFVFVVGFGFQVGVVLLMAAPVEAAMPWYSVLVANVLGALAVGVVLGFWHDGLSRRVSTADREA